MGIFPMGNLLIGSSEAVLHSSIFEIQNREKVFGCAF